MQAARWEMAEAQWKLYHQSVVSLSLLAQDKYVLRGHENPKLQCNNQGPSFDSNPILTQHVPTTHLRIRRVLPSMQPRAICAARYAPHLRPSSEVAREALQGAQLQSAQRHAVRARHEATLREEPWHAVETWPWLCDHSRSRAQLLGAFGLCNKATQRMRLIPLCRCIELM